MQIHGYLILQAELGVKLTTRLSEGNKSQKNDLQLYLGLGMMHFIYQPGKESQVRVNMQLLCFYNKSLQTSY